MLLPITSDLPLAATASLNEMAIFQFVVKLVSFGSLCKRKRYARRAVRMACELLFCAFSSVSRSRRHTISCKTTARLRTSSMAHRPAHHAILPSYF
jgi:hypothetical protein